MTRNPQFHVHMCIDSWQTHERTTRAPSAEDACKRALAWAETDDGWNSCDESGQAYVIRLTRDGQEIDVPEQFRALDQRALAGFDARELATVIAALRYWNRALIPGEILSTSTGADVVALAPDEIDALCERLNCGG